MQGGAKRACYAFVARDRTRIIATRCALRQCSEASVLVAHRAHVLLQGCVLAHCPSAFMSGVGLGLGIELSYCTLEGSA